jgi:hypothetical protein
MAQAVRDLEGYAIRNLTYLQSHEATSKSCSSKTGRLRKLSSLSAKLAPIHSAACRYLTQLAGSG